MSIIIRGGRMPSGCGMCVMSRYFFSTGTMVCMLTLATLAGNDKAVSSDERHKDCPLMELPEKHGRLIDADALLIKTINNPLRAPYIVERDIQDMPTIVEAEGEE